MGNLDDLLVGGQLTDEAKALGFTDDDLSGGHFADPVAAQAKLDAPSEDESDESDEDEEGAPKKSALKADWVAYAVSQGMPEDEADAMSKPELIDKFG